MPSKKLATRVTATVRAEMARRDITQTSLARKLGRSQQFISRRISGAVPFSLDELADIAAALGIPITDLVNEPPPPTRRNTK